MHVFELGVLVGAVILGALPLCGAQTPRPAPERYYVALRAGDETGDLTLQNVDGATIEEISPDPDGDAALGPLRPGHYTLCLDGVAAGEFVLNENAAVMLTTGRLWTDGELLHLEPDTPGAILLKLALPGPGTYPVYLTGEDVSRTAVAQIGADDAQDPGGGYTRCVQFEGLMAGCYTLTCRGEAIASLELARGEVKSLALAVN